MKNLLIIMLVLLFAVPVSAMVIGDIETSSLGPNTLIEQIVDEGPERISAFSYSDEIKVVIAVVSFSMYIAPHWEFETVRYLKDGNLHYYAWNAELKEYVLTEAPADLKGSWILQLKEYAGGI